MLLLVDLLRIASYGLSWLVVGLNHAADALEYRQQTMQRIQAGSEAIPVPVKW